MSPLDDYTSLKDTVETAGYFTTPMPIKVSGDRMVCASKQDQYGLSGVSFWVAKRGIEWFIAAWGGSIYKLPPNTHIEAAAIDALRTHQGTPFDFSEEFKARFSLTEVTGEEFDSLPHP